jgi:hypothetical protein
MGDPPSMISITSRPFQREESNVERKIFAFYASHVIGKRQLNYEVD